jgi:hypothetical protein
MYFLVTRPVCAPFCGTRYAHVRTVFNTVVKLPLYIAVCAVLCQLKLMLGAYCVGVR